MPELPEVEVLVRHLKPLLQGRTIHEVQVLRPKVIAPTNLRKFKKTIQGSTFLGLSRRGKYLLFNLGAGKGRGPVVLLGHLGMTGRMYLLPPKPPLPKHAAVVFDLGRDRFVYEDTRYFGRLTLDLSSLDKLGPEPLSEEFTAEKFALALQRSEQSIKVKLLDQSLLAGVGNIYASEALFRAGISPRKSARRLRSAEVGLLWRALREVLAESIDVGSTLPLNYAGNGPRDGLFYFGSSPETPPSYEERFRVYDRAGQDCLECGATIRRLVQAARSTYYCPQCQSS